MLYDLNSVLIYTDFSIIKKQLSIFYDFKVIIVKDINDVFNTV